MKRTQIQLPDSLYKRLKQYCEIEETTLADVIRRASEYFLALYPNREKRESSWQLPTPRELGDFAADDGQWRLEAHEPDLNV